MDDVNDLIGDEPPGVIATMSTDEREDEFLRLIGSGCSVREAAAGVGVHFTTMYRKRNGDEAFRKRWEAATRVRLDSLVAEAERRAMRGSDKLLMFLLTNYAPERFKRHSALEITNPDGSLAATGSDRAERTAALLATAAARRAEAAARAVEDLV